MLIAAATRMSSFEGASGYFVVACGLVVALFGPFLGVWLAFRIAGKPAGIGAVAGYTGLTVGTLFAVAAGIIVMKLLFDDTLNRNAAPRQALFEIRLPPGSALDR